MSTIAQTHRKHDMPAWRAHGNPKHRLCICCKKARAWVEAEPEIAEASRILEETRQHFCFLTAGSWNCLEEAGIKVTCFGLHRDVGLPSCLSKCKNVSGFGVKR